jgi:hypothetical protein
MPQKLCKGREITVVGEIGRPIRREKLIPERCQWQLTIIHPRRLVPHRPIEASGRVKRLGIWRGWRVLGLNIRFKMDPCGWRAAMDWQHVEAIEVRSRVHKGNQVDCEKRVARERTS